jgi:hypothetical protein
VKSEAPSEYYDQNLCSIRSPRALPQLVSAARQVRGLGGVARLSEHYPTAEIRVSDECVYADDAALIAALARALVETADFQRSAFRDGSLARVIERTAAITVR